MRAAFTVLMTLALTPLLAASPSVFEGTWRPERQLPGPNSKPESVQFVGGIYDCKGCNPPFKIKADGHDQAVPENPIYDSMSISALDPHTVKGVAKKNGTQVGEVIITVSPDGTTKSERTTLTGVAPKPVEVTSRYRRVGDGAPGSHPVSGVWQLIDTDVTNHAEDTTFKITDGKLVMTDQMGGAYAAKLDGTPAPFTGNPRFDAVAIKLVDVKTIEESDLKDGKVAQKRRWSLGADGNSIHATFDDLQGHVQQQTGHRVR